MCSSEAYPVVPRCERRYISFTGKESSSFSAGRLGSAEGRAARGVTRVTGEPRLELKTQGTQGSRPCVHGEIMFVTWGLSAALLSLSSHVGVPE